MRRARVGPPLRLPVALAVALFLLASAGNQLAVVEGIAYRQQVEWEHGAGVAADCSGSGGPVATGARRDRACNDWASLHVRRVRARPSPGLRTVRPRSASR